MIASPAQGPGSPDEKENTAEPPHQNPPQNGKTHSDAQETGLALQSAEATGSALSLSDSSALEPAHGAAESAIAVKTPETVVPRPPVASATIPRPSEPSPAALLAASLAASCDVLRERIAAQPLRRRSLFLAGVGPREGTTTTALHLARSLARDPVTREGTAEPAAVLLVELRFASPQLRQRLGQSLKAPGLEDGLHGTVALGSCILKDAESTLSTLTIKAPLSPEEAAHQSGPLNDFLQWAEERFDWLVLDCPPIGSAEWTLWFDLNADPVLLVARAGITRERAVRRAARRLKDRLAGAILLQSF